MKPKNRYNPFISEATCLDLLRHVMSCTEHKATDALPRRYILQEKLDGIRTTVYFDGGAQYQWQFYSSEGVYLSGFTHVMQEYTVGWAPITGFALDGEIYSPKLKLAEINGFASRHQLLGLPSGLSFHPFDLLPLSFNTAFIDQEKRLAILHNHHYSIPTLEGDFDSILESFRGTTKEGIIIRDLEGMYEFGKRSPYVKKFKFLHDAEYKILALKEGQDSFTGILGSFLVETDSGILAVGGGNMSHADRAMYWAAQESLIGRYIKVTFPSRGPTGLPLQAQFRELLPESFTPNSNPPHAPLI